MNTSTRSLVVRSTAWIQNLIGACLAFIAVSVNGQNINFTAPEGCPNNSHTFAAPAVVDEEIDITIGADNPPAAVTMEILSIEYIAGGAFTSHCSPCGSPQTVGGITLTASGATVTVQGVPDDTFQAGGSITFVLRANSTSDCDRTYTLEIQRKPLDLCIVLDRSGSMGWGFDGNASPPAGQRRWDGLETGIGVLAAHLELNLTALGGSDDTLGLRYFASNVIVPGAAPFNGGLVNMAANDGSLPTEVATQTPGGSTALGDGIIAARDLLLDENDDHNKAMIVFSDGVQNSGDMVKAVDPNAYVQTESGQELNGPANEIDIYTICLGSAGHNPMLMQEIAANNGGEYANTLAGAEGDFVTFFTAHLINILAGNSPQFVDIRKGAFPVTPDATSSIEQSFSTNASISNFIVTLLAPRKNEPRITSLMKDGVELIQFARRISGKDFISVGLNFPITALPAATPGGDWTIRAQLGTSPAEEIPYSMTIVVDDHEVDLAYELGSTNTKVNDTLQPFVVMRHAGEPIENAQVQMIVAKPGDDVNHLLAIADIDFDVPQVDPGSPATAKLAALMKDPAFLKQIGAQDQVITLNYDSADERYEGSFNALDVVGVHQAIFLISVDDPELGKIRRYHRESFYVRFLDIDQGNSVLGVSQNPAGNSVISFKPISSVNKLVGVGWGGAISLKSSNAKISEIVDKADGSYDLVIDGTLAGPGKLTLSGETVFQGNLEDLVKSSGQTGIPPWVFWIILIILLAIVLLAILKRKSQRP